MIMAKNSTFVVEGFTFDDEDLSGLRQLLPISN